MIRAPEFLAPSFQTRAKPTTIKQPPIISRTARKAGPNRIGRFLRVYVELLVLVERPVCVCVCKDYRPETSQNNTKKV